MNNIAAERSTVNSPAPRMIVDIDGKRVVVDHGACRRPTGIDIAILPRPGHRIVGFRETEI